MAEANNRKLISVLQDVRKLRRNLRLRSETDPEVVGQVLETIMREAITLRSYNSGRIGRGAVNELRNIRRDLVAGNINAGSKTSAFVGKYSAVLDQIESIEHEAKSDEGGVAKSVAASISQNLPSADTLTAALMTANPVLGYTTKIARDLLRARSDSKHNIKSKQDQRIAQLNKEQAEAEAQLAELEQSDAPDEQIQDVVARLDVIKEEIVNLARIWGDDRETNLEQVAQGNETNDLLERVAEENEDSTSSLEKIKDLETERDRREQSRDSRANLIDRESEFEGGKFAAGSAGMLKEGDDKNGLDIPGFGLMSGMGGAIGGMVAKIFTPFKFLFGILLKGGVILGKFAAIGGLIISAFNGIAGFFDGFMNAAEVLGLTEGTEVTLMDRFKAASAAMIAGLLSPLNWILDIFGLGFAEDEKDIRDKTVSILNDMKGFADRVIASIGEFFSIENLTENVLPQIDRIAKDVSSMLMSNIDQFSEAIFGISVTDAIDKVKEYFEKAIERATEKFKELFENIFNWTKEKYENVKKGVTAGVDVAKETVSGVIETTGNAITDAKNSVFDFLGFDSPEARATRERLEDSPDTPSGKITRVTRSFNSEGIGMEEDEIFKQPWVFAPSNTTNVSNSNVEMSTGARNNDNSYMRVQQRNMMFR